MKRPSPRWSGERRDELSDVTRIGQGLVNSKRRRRKKLVDCAWEWWFGNWVIAHPLSVKGPPDDGLNEAWCLSSAAERGRSLSRQSPPLCVGPSSRAALPPSGAQRSEVRDGRDDEWLCTRVTPVLPCCSRPLVLQRRGQPTDAV
ncbi:hypothetical protein AAFF_G00278690 [Aldrovandia affinis]|uniref:Uncharacterized protein n=1 Tax=Aldrovandia affinis TaxID=143900 RepID=A0AAD7WSE0_9TELE|nr:hypothetical protein AAFF_G00278690 [Aldrovandia affinis]